MSGVLRQHRWLIAIVLGFVAPTTAHAEVLTRERVIELARTRALVVRIAETRIVEARERLVLYTFLAPKNLAPRTAADLTVERMS